jgi:hypothetical protein
MSTAVYARWFHSIAYPRYSLCCAEMYFYGM